MLTIIDHGTMLLPWNKEIRIDANIRILLVMQGRKVKGIKFLNTKDNTIIVGSENQSEDQLISEELKSKGIDFVLKLMQILNEDQYNKLISHEEE